MFVYIRIIVNLRITALIVEIIIINVINFVSVNDL